jgi:hypothetical protein
MASLERFIKLSINNKGSLSTLQLRPVQVCILVQLA